MGNHIVFIGAFVTSGIILAVQWLLDVFLSQPSVKVVSFLLFTIIFLGVGFGVKMWLHRQRQNEKINVTNTMLDLRDEVATIKQMLTK